jgi:hypothetical protein
LICQLEAKNRLNLFDEILEVVKIDVKNLSDSKTNLEIEYLIKSGKFKGTRFVESMTNESDEVLSVMINEFQYVARRNGNGFCYKTWINIFEQMVGLDFEADVSMLRIDKKAFYKVTLQRMVCDEK